MEVSADNLTLLKVGELAKKTGKTVRAVHLYEELGLLTPAVRSKGGFRLYSGKAARRIEWIQKLQDLGFSLTEIKAFLRDWEDSETAPKAMDRMREIFTDKLRETLFNILAPRIAGTRFLDLYAGTGAVGIEALSRGATAVTFVESDKRAETLISENLAHCGVENGYAIIRATVARAIDQLDAAAFGPYELFDIVWFDPPYDDEQPDAVLDAAGVLIAPGGLLVLEHARRRQAPETAARLVRVRQVTGGDSALSFYELKN